MDDENKVYYGRISYFCKDKLYGQIEGNDGIPVFLHQSEIINDCKYPGKSQAVKYCKRKEPGKRDRAILVEPLN